MQLWEHIVDFFLYWQQRSHIGPPMYTKFNGWWGVVGLYLCLSDSPFGHTQTKKLCEGSLIGFPNQPSQTPKILHR